MCCSYYFVHKYLFRVIHIFIQLIIYNFTISNYGFLFIYIFVFIYIFISFLNLWLVAFNSFKTFTSSFTSSIFFLSSFCNCLYFIYSLFSVSLSFFIFPIFYLFGLRDAWLLQIYLPDYQLFSLFCSLNVLLNFKYKLL